MQEEREIAINNNIILDNRSFKIISKIGAYKSFVTASGDNPFGILSNQHGNIIEYNDKDAILVKDDIEEHFNITELKDISLLYKFKVTIGKMNPDRGGVNGSDSWNVINVPKALRPRFVIAQNYMVLYASSDVMEASRFLQYCKAKFFRFMALQGLSGASLSTAETWRFVPLQDFTSNSDIDWSQSIADIDKQLYRKYNLTEEEIDYIEKTIKPM